MIQSAKGVLVPLQEYHEYALHTSSPLTTQFRVLRQPQAVDATPEALLAILNEAVIPCVLMGTHALNTWRSEPRATQDTDLLVRKKDVRKTVNLLKTAFPNFLVDDLPDETRFLEPTMGKPVIEVMKPARSIFQVVFRYSIRMGPTHSIPDLEMALVSKFAAMVSPNRQPARKMVDAGDFIDVVTYNRERIDVKKLMRLAEYVYPGASKEIARMIRDIDAGKTLQI